MQQCYYVSVTLYVHIITKLFTIYHDIFIMNYVLHCLLQSPNYACLKIIHVQ